MWCLPELRLTWNCNLRTTCQETPRKISARANCRIGNYEYFRKTGYVHFLRQNPNLILPESYHLCLQLKKIEWIVLTFNISNPCWHFDLMVKFNLLFNTFIYYKNHKLWFIFLIHTKILIDFLCELLDQGKTYVSQNPMALIPIMIKGKYIL